MTRMAATRDGYGQALLDLAENEKVVVLEADLGKSTKSLHFRKAHPERTVSCGIGEQNMLLVGACSNAVFARLVLLKHVHNRCCAAMANADSEKLQDSWVQMAATGTHDGTDHSWAALCKSGAAGCFRH